MVCLKIFDADVCDLAIKSPEHLKLSEEFLLVIGRIGRKNTHKPIAHHDVNHEYLFVSRPVVILPCLSPIFQLVQIWFLKGGGMAFWREIFFNIGLFRI
jgi:hypothetical protein